MGPLTIVPPVPLREPSVQLELLVRIVPLANGLMLLLVSVPVRTVVPVNQIARPKQPLTIVPTVLLVNLLLVAMLVPPVPLREPSVLLVVPVRIVPLANGLMLLLVSVPVRTVVPVNQIARPKQPLTIVPTVLLVKFLLKVLRVPIVLPVKVLPLHLQRADCAAGKISAKGA